MRALDDAAIAERLRGLPGWALREGQVTRTFQFADFLASMRFVERVAEEAERCQHHPDILIRYSRVTLSVSTHDAGGITEKDFSLAAAADALAAAAGARAP